MDFWIKDPNNKQPSVSLSLLMIAFSYVIIMSTLFALEKLKSMGASMEVFFAAASLYFGRRLSFSNNKSNSLSNGADKNEEEK